MSSRALPPLLIHDNGNGNERKYSVAGIFRECNIQTKYLHRPERSSDTGNIRDKTGPRPVVPDFIHIYTDGILSCYMTSLLRALSAYSFWFWLFWSSGYSWPWVSSVFPTDNLFIRKTGRETTVSLPVNHLCGRHLPPARNKDLPAVVPFRTSLRIPLVFRKALPIFITFRVRMCKAQP